MKPNLMHFFRRYTGWVAALALVSFFIINSNASDYPKAKGDVIVHYTTYGHKYHRAGCRYLRKSDYTETLQEAINHGLTPCSICKPPVLDDGK